MKRCPPPTPKINTYLYRLPATSPPETKQLRLLFLRVPRPTGRPHPKGFCSQKIWQLLPLQSLLLNNYNYFTSTLNVLIKVHDMCFILGLNSLAVCQTRRPQNASVPRLPTHGPTEDSCGKRGLHVSFHRFCSCSKPDITRSIRPPRRGGWEWRQHVAQVGRLTWDRPQVWES